MKQLLSLILLLCLAACGGRDTVAANAVTPDLNMMAETPGDWSGIAQAVGRTPAESGLLQRSDVSVDLNALLGGKVEAFRLALGDATPLTREGGLLVTRGRSGNAYLVIDANDHALEAGLKKGGRWQRFSTPGAELVPPPSIVELTAR